MTARNDIKVWDPLIRLFHWSLVAAFTLAYLTEDDFMTLHVYAGYLVGGLVLFRLVWGFIGTRHARFSDFVYAPAAVLAYLKELLLLRAPRYIGHNPAGGAMILVLLGSLLLTTFTGLATYGAEGGGPLAGTVLASGAFEDIHEFFANFTLLLVIIHIGAVVGSSLLHRENLIRAMVTGRKPE
ncbi:cytochrome b/b6 domain-containing protein [Thiohalomonas denitrificans]|uniref:Cytochrome b n=1 Tax=Thiohalomonas denitrificans TaxID=415747 RepID=A0A1G5PL95_9GAMM|nr:cytochrome b/b6 domain-containing protein [Thiohalomonas denitrificans]SCZ49951.1 Cytochrome b [Thiohalomonas denitrificans]